MKKSLILVLALTLALTFTACGDDSDAGKSSEANNSAEASNGSDANNDAEANKDSDANNDAEGDVKSEGVMTYAEYAAAALDTEVTVEAYVQAHQSWWEKEGVGKITVYAQDKDGAYFMYEMNCSKEDSEKLVPGTKIKVTGYKSEWAGEVEIIDASFEILEGSYIAEPVDVTTYLGLDDLANYQNQFVSFKSMTVETYEKDGVSYDSAFVYNDDNSGSHDSNSDLYFNVSSNGTTYTFCVESYLCDKDTDVYKAVENLKAGDVVDLEGFLYWYNGANPHITSVTVK